MPAAPLIFQTPAHQTVFWRSQIMRGKIRGRQYVNWHELVRDFELICSNAMRYNQKRSRVHKAVRMPGVGSVLLG